MASASGYDNDKSINHGLIDHEENTTAQRQNSADDDCVKSSLRLPARALPPRRSLLPFAVTASAAFVFIVCMIVLLHYLPDLLPDQPSNLYPGETRVSCDLTVSSGSRLQNAFMINLRSAQQLSFPAAKLIDVIWDLVIGQGGRLLMAWAAYRVFMDALVTLMETTSVSYDVYSSLVFDTTSLLSTWKATKALIKSGSWRSRVFMFWFCLASFYILSFPTLMGAATGYVSPSTVGYNMDDGSFVTASSASLTSCVTLYDGDMIQEPNGTIYPGPQALVAPFYKASSQSSDDSQYEEHRDYWELRDYIPKKTYSMNSTNSTDTPSVYPYTSFYPYTELNYTTNITWHNHTYVFNNSEFTTYDIGFCYNGKPTMAVFNNGQRCLPETYFVWGFSSLLLEIILYLQIVWTFTMIFIWIHANSTSQLLFKNRRVRGSYRATADLAEALTEVVGDEFCAYSDSEIARELKREGNGLRYYTVDNNDRGISHIGLGNHDGLRFGLDNSRLYGAIRRRRKSE
ncbi:MAG: hypothetical protein Q9195_002305 [Heterodermia aff. obscurata]